MSFVQAGFLFALAAIAIPVAVHLLSRWQVRRLELGTMRFLQEVIHEGARGRRIRRWLLLITRAALLALLALLFARPFFAEQRLGAGERLRVVLIDRSARMGMPGKNGRLVDDAVEKAVEINQQSGENATIYWAWFDHQVDPIPATTVRPTAPQAVVGDTDYANALRWARNKIDASPNAIADVLLVTDLQRSGLASNEFSIREIGFPNDASVRVIDVGRPVASNLAITEVLPQSTRLQAQQSVRIAVTLFNYGTDAREDVPLIASAFDGTRNVRQEKPISLLAGHAAEVSFDFGILAPGTWQVSVAIDVDDDMASDNQRFTGLVVAEPIRVLVLDSGNRERGMATKSYYLVTALEQGQASSTSTQFTSTQPTRTTAFSGDTRRSSRFQAEVVYLSAGAPPAFDSTTHPLVIVADARSLSTESIERLERYVIGGGKLLLFAGDGAGLSDDRWKGQNLAPGDLGVPIRSGAMPFRIASVVAGDTMLQPFEDPQHGDLSRLRFQKLQPVSVNESVNVMAWFDPSRPAITQHNLGNGRVVWFLSSADDSWGSWPSSPLYLPLVQQMAGDLLNLTGEGPVRFRTVGDNRPTIDNDVDRGTVTKNVGSTMNNQITSVAFQETEMRDNRALTYSQPGFSRSDALYVVNGAIKESDPTRMKAEDLTAHFGLTKKGNFGEAVNALSAKRHELWPWLAAAALVLLFTEFALANRTSA